MSTRKDDDSIDKLMRYGCGAVIGNLLGYVVIAIVMLVFLFKCV